MKFQTPIKLSRFDTIVLTIIFVLVAAIALLVIVGDQVGVTIVTALPSEATASSSPIVIRFSQTMNRPTVAEHFQIQPSINGTFDWSGTTLTFRPTQALQQGIRYTVTLRAGMESEGGRKLLHDFSFNFAVRSPRIAYLSPADNSAPANIWIASLVDPSNVQQITFSPSGITSFSVSPTGNQIVFAERNGSTGLSDIKLLDLETGGLIQLTNCPDSRCERPVWSPVGNMIAYERVDFNSDLATINVPFSPSRVWLVNLTTEPPTTYPLFNDNQILGYSPAWSENGNRIAVYDRGLPGVRVYDFAQDRTIALPSNYGVPGFLSPDGTRLILPETEIDNSGMNSHLQVIDLTTQEISIISAPSDLVSEQMAAWRPDGRAIVIARRNLSDESRGDQLYIVNAITLQARPLEMDAQYTNEFFFWDPGGTHIAIQRALRDELDTSAPEIWIYDMTANRLTQVATNAFNVHWMP